jgi:hypothetical protein
VPEFRIIVDVPESVLLIFEAEAIVRGIDKEQVVYEAVVQGLAASMQRRSK